jgi:hypothetical protein
MIDGGTVKVPVLSQVWLPTETSALELISASLTATSRSPKFQNFARVCRDF